MGGHVRVGLEDAIYFDWQTKRLATNAGLIDRIVRLAHAAGRNIATIEATIPSDFWAELKREKLVADEAPLPA